MESEEAAIVMEGVGTVSALRTIELLKTTLLASKKRRVNVILKYLLCLILLAIACVILVLIPVKDNYDKQIIQ
jgi:hypothetical protein